MKLSEPVRQLLFDQQAQLARRLSVAEHAEIEALEDATRRHNEAARLRALIAEIDATLRTRRGTPRGEDEATDEATETQVLPTVEQPLPHHLSPRRRRR